MARNTKGGASPRKPATQKADPFFSFRERFAIVRYGGRCALTLCGAVVLYSLSLCLHEIAGTRTDLNIGVSITVAVTGMAAAIREIANARKQKNQRLELVRLRERAKGLEEQNGKLIRQLGNPKE